jgi:hypothetical protein
MRWFARFLCLTLFVAISAPTPADAQPVPSPPPREPLKIQTQITMIRTGWNAEQFGIVTVAPIQNPAGCPTWDGYVTDSSQPGYHTYYAAALLAFAERATVIVVVAAGRLEVSGVECVSGRPKLIGINIVR